MAAVLHQSSLKRIDVTFATPCWTTTTTQTNSASPPLRLTEALKHNTCLQKLCLRGVIPDDQTHHYVPFLQVLEHDNTTLEELVLTHPECNHHNNNDNRQRKLQFFLQLNRQPLLNQQGFRTLLRSLDEAIPPHLVLPCLQAAQAADEALHPPDVDDDDDDDDDLEEDFYGYIYHSPSWQATTQHKKKKRGTVSALYYLLRQQPSLIHLACQQQQSRRQKQQQQPCDAMQGDSPQLLLLDDDIVALW
ncbi:expressed unknown protein [Seminavis robusta]|uniref:Uncharacterized protein n=1 Tax=Seminavis robusta TaxID=568900 RepID=A0A9N8HTG6_9STRA|nr:expressed unknown protein [Seminavis robusta]|eukprot:Sro1585_g284080.1 n/a (247) ;mRNA; f:8410-9150